MARKKRLKRFQNSTEVIEFIHSLVAQVDSILERSPEGIASPTLDRYLKRATSALIDAGGVIDDQLRTQSERELAQQKALACARLRARGIPELPVHVTAEVRRIRKAP